MQRRRETFLGRPHYAVVALGRQMAYPVQQRARGGLAKILLVEDNEMNCGMLARLLERRGYQVVIAIDGDQSVRLAQVALRRWENRGIELEVPCLALDVMLNQEHREEQL
jgi:hypothetical protein